ncbi:MAG: peptidase T [Clostridia bacterium]|nr:peptidase T [Clostridia bacterium]
MEDVLSRFLRYVRVDTPSDPGNDSVMPSSGCQKDLAKMLARELEEMGVPHVETDENGYVYAYVDANAPSSTAIGFISHMDTVCEPSGIGVKPQVVKSYGGGDIMLPSGAVISPTDFPEMENYKGGDIVTSDGTTVLGADDKAGVAEIMTVAKYICDHKEFRHGKIGFAFTPDEEIGNGASRFDVERFGCDFAYTVDGEEIGELSYETFNAAAFTFSLGGLNIHPGSAKGKMVNSICIMNEIMSAFPAVERPETTEGREGFYFINHVEGNVEGSVIEGIVRDHDKKRFTERKAFVEGVAKTFSEKYPGYVTLEMKDQYYNCGEKIEPHFHLVENAAAAMRKCGVEPKIFPVRGGTDGSGLSFKGLPCPNLCTGGHNAHSVKEYVPVKSMEKMVDIILSIASAYTK